MIPQQWRNSGEYLTVNGRRMFVQSLGHGPPLLLLHAFPTSSYDYSRLVPILMDEYRLILFDYIGFGFSDKPRPHVYSLLEYADIAEAVAAHFGVQRMTLVAHDIGDSVALILLARQTLQIERLILLNGSVLSIPFDDNLMRVAQRLLLHPTIGPLLGSLGLTNRRFFALTAKKLFSYPLPRTELDTFWSLIAYNNGAPLYPVLMRYMLERWQYQHTWLEALAQHPAPLTLIWGQRDPIATPAVAQAVLARRSDATYFPLASVGHYPHWEAPEIVAHIIRQAVKE